MWLWPAATAVCNMMMMMMMMMMMIAATAIHK
jgi:hypothetical protein